MPAERPRPAPPALPAVRVDGLLRRGAAAALDLSLAGALFGALAFAMRWFPFVDFGPKRWNAFDYAVDELNAHLVGIALSLALFLLVALFVNLVCEVLWGAGVGRLMLGSTVLDTRGRPAGVGRLVVRNLLRVLEVPLFGLGVWLALVLPSKRTLHDVLSGTVVGRLE